MSTKKTRGLYKRKDSPCWWIRYTDENGRLVRISTDTPDKTLAKTILDKKRTLVAEGKHMEIKRLPNKTFEELCAEYWNTHGKNLRMKGLFNLIEIWKEGFGKTTPLRAITQQNVEKFLSERSDAEELKPATRNRHLTMLKALLNRAVEWKWLHVNPAAAIKNIRENGARTRFFSTAEIELLLSTAGDRFKPLLVTALHTGMRRGEILKLKWADVDFVNHIITVQESKSGKKRMIPMDDTLTAMLQKLPSRFKKGLVFPSNRKDAEGEAGNQALTDTNHTFTRLCEKVKITDVRFHDLRHTFASHLVMNGVDLKTVQELLGHATINMTMRYSHLAPAHQTKAVRVLDTAYAAAVTKSDTEENSVREAVVSSV